MEIAVDPEMQKEFDEMSKKSPLAGGDGAASQSEFFKGTLMTWLFVLILIQYKTSTLLAGWQARAPVRVPQVVAAAAEVNEGEAIMAADIEVSWYRSYFGSKLAFVMIDPRSTAAVSLHLRASVPGRKVDH